VGWSDLGVDLVRLAFETQDGPHAPALQIEAELGDVAQQPLLVRVDPTR